MDYINHYTAGVTFVEHKGKTIATSFNSPFDDYVKRFDDISVESYYIPKGYEHRIDLISNLFLNSPTKDWYIMYLNNIKDPLQELNVGDRIIIPTN